MLSILGLLLIFFRLVFIAQVRVFVALIDNEEATLKKFYRERGRIRLQPANEKYEPIWVDDCRIQGIVIGIVRTY